ncbi:hypothetical protein P7L75_09390 [Tistrella mobilis]|uniref:ArsR family transcriptional regulator n=1 Tax=Tistrella mobilis TaxID=171437 RepID=UPI003558D9BA
MTNTGFASAVAGSRRLAMLRALIEAEGTANESVIKTCLQSLGFGGRQLGDIRSDLDHLERAGMVRTSWYEGRVMVAAITARGVAYTRREVEPVPGIDYPSIGA